MISYRSGIYRITNKENGRVYIGRASDFTSRFHTHKLQLRNGTHANKELLSDWKKYGESCFVFEIVEYVHDEESDRLYELEKYWLDKFSNNYNAGKIPHSADGEKNQKSVVIVKCSSNKFWYSKHIGKTHLVIDEVVGGRYKIVGANKYLDARDVQGSK